MIGTYWRDMPPPVFGDPNPVGTVKGWQEIIDQFAAMEQAIDELEQRVDQLETT